MIEAVTELQAKLNKGHDWLMAIRYDEAIEDAVAECRARCRL